MIEELSRSFILERILVMAMPLFVSLSWLLARFAYWWCSDFFLVSRYHLCSLAECLEFHLAISAALVLEKK